MVQHWPILIIDAFIFFKFLDYRISNNIIGVEWSIPIEVFWYLLLPLIILLMKGWNGAILMLTSALGVYILSEAFVHKIFVNAGSNSILALYWSPLPYFLSFVLGITAYKLRLTSIKWLEISNTILSLCAISIFIYCYKSRFILKIFDTEFIFVSIVTFLLILVGSKSNIIFNIIFCNKIILYIGAISYGIYLSHMPIYMLVKRINSPVLENSTIIFIIVLVLALVVSTVTHYLIEKRFSLAQN